MMKDDFCILVRCWSSCKAWGIYQCHNHLQRDAHFAGPLTLQLVLRIVSPYKQQKLLLIVDIQDSLDNINRQANEKYVKASSISSRKNWMCLQLVDISRLWSWSRKLGYANSLKDGAHGLLSQLDTTVPHLPAILEQNKRWLSEKLKEVRMIPSWKKWANEFQCVCMQWLL